MSDVICAKCGRHFPDIESARAHRCTGKSEFRLVGRRGSFHPQNDVLRSKELDKLEKIKARYNKQPNIAPTNSFQRPLTGTHFDNPRHHSPIITAISYIIVFVLFLGILGIIGGAIYGVVRYHDEIGGAFVSAYHWTEDKVVDISNSFHSDSSGAPSNSLLPSVNSGTVASVPPTNVGSTSVVPTSRTEITQTPSPTTSSIIAGNPATIDRSSFGAIDAHALAAPDSVEGSISSLASYLVEPAKNDVEKARAIFRWITKNISYDYTAYLSGVYNSTSAGDVLKSRSSVCQGYSNLFEALAKSAGLNVVTISGWAKGISYEVGQPITGPTNHAWNAVKINGAWYLIDSTWGAGHITGGQFVREYDDNYFFTPPNSFILNHLPEDSKWQLLPDTLSKTQFSSLPFVYSSFFTYGIGFGDNDQSVIETGNTLTMTFTVPSDTYLMVNLYRGTTELPENYVSATKSASSYQIKVWLPDPGDYVLRIYARSGGEYGMYDAVMEYKLISS